MICQDGHSHRVEQFPIRLFNSSTADKVQGQSLDRPGVLGGLNNQRSNYLYVTITRVHRLNQLYLFKELTQQDMTYTGPDPILRQEMERLAGFDRATIHRIQTCPRVAGMQPSTQA